MSYYEKYLKYKNKYLEIKKQFGGAKLTDLARTNPEFRSWCSTINDGTSPEVKLDEFQKFRELLDENEEVQVVTYLRKGGETPYWLTLALNQFYLSPRGEHLTRTKQATEEIHQALVYTMKVYPSKARHYFTELAKGNLTDVEYWVSSCLKNKNDELNEVIRLIDIQGIDIATDVIHRLVPNYRDYVRYMQRSVPSSGFSSGRAMSFDSSSRVDSRDFSSDFSSGRAMSADSSSKKYSLEDLVRTSSEFRDWAKNLHNRTEIAINLAKFESDFASLLNKGESQKVYDFLGDNTVTPSWITLSRLPFVQHGTPAPRVIQRIPPKLGSLGYLRTKAITNFYNVNDRTMTLKEPNVDSIKTQAYWSDYSWTVFHPFHEHCKTLHRSREHTFIEIDIPISVLKNEAMWD